MKILHSGDGHYHLGGDHDHDHDHDHGHGHEHGHSHGHSHGENHTHSDKSKKNHKKVKDEEKGLKEGLINEDKHDHSHEHSHDHSHDHTHDHSHHHDHDHKKERGNINIDSAYLHVLGDMIMSIGVIIASAIIYIEPSYEIADPLCTYFFSIIVLFTTLPVFKECIFVLLEATPSEIDIQ